MSARIAITGAGIISAIGVGKDETLRSLIARKSGVGRLRHLQTAHSGLPCGEVNMSDEELKNALGLPTGSIIPRTTLLGIIAVKEAMEQAGIKGTDRAALISGTTVGGMDLTECHYIQEGESSFFSLHDCGSCTDGIADFFGGFGLVTTISTACSSAANSIMLGADLIKSGRCEVVVAGGSECLTRYHLNGFNSLKILDSEPCRPFDATRNGLNLGEGSGFVVLESEEHALNRGVAPIGALDGYGNACDAFHQTASSDDGEGAFLAMSKALNMSGLKPGDIDYVNAHGTATPNNDASESRAMIRLFGDKIPPVSSTKAFTGHTTSAAGSIEAVICLLAIRHGFIPANLNWKEPFDGGVVPDAEGHQGVRLDHVLCNSFGFGGNDSSLLISRYGK